VVTYLHTDQLGSVRMITSATGASVGTANFTAYGTGTTTGTTSPFGYAGQYTDTESGLQWMRARYYDPTTAQFLTVDPLAAATGTRYSYASGNPITMADPTGLCSWYDLACDVSAMTREQLPDFVNLNVGIVFPIGELPIGIGGGWNVTVTRDGHVYTGPEVVAGVAGLSASLEGGWIDNCSVPTSDQLDQFVNGFGLTADGYVPVAAGLGPAGGKTWGNEGGGKPSDTSTNFGVGMGVGRWLSVSQGYNWRTGAKGEGW
jgi:RHS repeat-associated protein